MTSPAFPNLTPLQKALAGIVCAIATADGRLSRSELDVMLDELATEFALESEEKPALRQQLQELSAQPVPLETLVAHLDTNAAKEAALKLSYIVVQAGDRSSETLEIDPQEKMTYRRLVELLALPESIVEQIEWAADQNFQAEDNLVTTLISGFRKFFNG